MMTKLNTLLIISLAMTLLSCKSKWQYALKKADRALLYGNSIDGWKLIQEIDEEWSTNYTISKIEKDTLKVLFYAMSKKDGEIFINEYDKKFNCNNADTCYLKMSSQDTLFYYRLHDKQRIFEVGEYAYRFSNLKLSNKEIDYYLNHEDSLRRVRGNNLPPLSK